MYECKPNRHFDFERSYLMMWYIRYFNIKVINHLTGNISTSVFLSISTLNARLSTW